MNFKQKYHVIGVMSGTSLDGLDIVKCVFEKKSKWQFYVEKAYTVKYSKRWKKTLKYLHLKKNTEIQKTHFSYGKFIAEEITKFIKKYNLHAEIISSHGHTIFHNPKKKLTLQIGCGRTIAQLTKKTTITDFRSLDVKLGGQGAPLVPIGDLLLFGKYKYCLNIGGFANVSVKTEDNITAYDICPVNFILNHFSNKIGKDFDFNGDIAKEGKLNSDLLRNLNSLSFYKKFTPKSLSREWVERKIFPLINSNISVPDYLHTFCEHIGFQIGSYLKNKETLITGGGAFNSFLIQKILTYSNSKLIIPDKTTVDFKEAIIFGLLGILRLRNEINSLSTVTGASRDSSGGKIFNY